MPVADPRLGRASACLQAGDAAGCLALCNELLISQPGLPAAHHMRGIAAASLGNADLAISDFSHVWSVQPTNLKAALGLGSLLRQADRLEEALAPLEAARLDPELEVAARYELGRVFTRLRRTGEAMGEYRSVLQRNPGHADAEANLAFLLERANRLEEAETRADRVLRMKPGHFMAALTKAIVERRRGEPESAQRRLEALAEGSAGFLNRSIVLNQLGQCHETAESWDKAFDCYRESNRLLRDGHPLGKPAHEGSYGLGRIRTIEKWLQANPPRGWSGNGSSTPDEPVFLVGFPRSGTTLLDQALSAHPDIEVLEEFELFGEVRRRWVDGAALSRLATMSHEEIQAARETYIAALRSKRMKPECGIVVDKLPLNLVYLFLIHRLFPRSRVILMVRDPRDACLSCYFQAFDLQGAMPYFLDFRDTVNYYDEVMKLFIETKAAVTNPLMTVQYERMVNHFETELREVIAFLGAGWTPEVLDYRQKSQQRIISTPSYQQVGQPLYTRSIGRWRHYRARAETELGPLNHWVDYFGYSRD